MRRLALLLSLASCTVPREPDGRADNTCAACHGDPTRAGDSLTRAAPPKDLHGNTGVEYPGVGAHQQHLGGTEIYPAVKCESCHPVPMSVGDDGHNDGTVQLLVQWDPASRTCAGVACHASVRTGTWTKPREEACGTCHGVPPPAPHPQAGECAGCHGPLTAATHVDGKVTMRQPLACNTCHGTDETGAPPRSLDGGTSNEQRGVGAHQRHLTGSAVSRAVPCATCHAVPAKVDSPGHADGTVEVLSGYDAGSLTCATGCHFGASPTWTTAGPLTCSGCHDSPPKTNHPQLPNCELCHPVNQPALHVDGKVDVTAPAACDGCHGSATNPAPPRSLDGGADRGVHQAHLVGRGYARPVQCSECHVVPAQTRAPGHLDGVLTVKFSGAAVANLAMPAFANGTCTNTACHDPSIWRAGSSAGGTNPSPEWSSPDGGPPSTCWSCHGQPPPPPHPPVPNDCNECHTFSPATHVNGVVDFK